MTKISISNPEPPKKILFSDLPNCTWFRWPMCSGNYRIFIKMPSILGTNTTDNTAMITEKGNIERCHFGDESLIPETDILETVNIW